MKGGEIDPLVNMRFNNFLIINGKKAESKKNAYKKTCRTYHRGQKSTRKPLVFNVVKSKSHENWGKQWERNVCNRRRPHMFDDANQIKYIVVFSITYV